MKHSFRHYLEYIVMLVFQTVIRMLSLKAVVFSADLIASTIILFVKPRNRIVMKNLSIAFPDMNMTDKKKVRDMCYRQILMSSFESYKYMFLTKAEKLDHLIVDEESRDLLLSVKNMGKGCIVVGGHYGFFEAGGLYATCHGIKSAYVVANQKNKLTEKLIDIPREKAGILIIHRKQMTKLFRALKDSYFIALLSDQNAGRKHGVFIDFFGLPASTHKNPAVLCMKYNVPMLIVNTVRNKDDRSKHDLSFKEVKFDDILASSADFDEKVLTLVQRYSKILEDQIRKEPSHYWWIHKRYKTRPDKEKSFYK